MDLYQDCSNYAPGVKNDPAPGHVVYIDLDMENLTNLLQN